MAIGAVESARTGISRATEQVSRAAAKTARLSEQPATADPVGAVVERHQGALMYRANLRVMRAADEMLGALLDAQA